MTSPCRRACMAWLSWRNTFALFGSIGAIWAFVFYRAFRDQAFDGHPLALPVRDERLEEKMEPDEDTPVDREPERGSGDRLKVPWRELLRSRTVWLLWAQYFCLTYGWFFYVTWLPTYLKETRGLELDRNAFMLWLGKALGEFLSAEMSRKVLVAALAGVPLFFGGLGAIFCGLATPRLIRATGSVARTRKMIALVGFTGASVLLV